MELGSIGEERAVYSRLGRSRMAVVNSSNRGERSMDPYRPTTLPGEHKVPQLRFIHQNTSIQRHSGTRTGLGTFVGLMFALSFGQAMVVF